MKIFNFLKNKREIISYLIFGALTTVINWSVYLICLFLSSKQSQSDITVANAIAWIVSVLFAFITNKLFVFESRELRTKTLVIEIIKFISSRALSGIFEIFAPSFLISIGLTQSFLSIKGFWAKLVTSIIVVIMNYILSKLVVFERR